MLYLSFGDKRNKRHNEVPDHEIPFQPSGKVNFSFYARVERLYRGQYFLHLADETRKFVMVSRGSTIIRISRESLDEMGVMDHITEHTSSYPQDNEIANTFMIHNEWRYYKKIVIESEATKIAQKSARMGLVNQNPEKIAMDVGRKHRNYSYHHDTEGCKKLPLVKKDKLNNKPKLIHSIRLPLYKSKEFYNQALPMIDAYYD